MFNDARVMSGVRSARGFSLLEMMLVVVIIGLLASVVVFNVAGQGDRARISTTKAKISQVKNAIDSFRIDKGNLPANLSELTAGTTPLLDRVPDDAWDNALYYSPRKTADGKHYTLISAGKDGEIGTEDDINVWTMDDDSAD